MTTSNYVVGCRVKFRPEFLATIYPEGIPSWAKEAGTVINIPSNSDRIELVFDVNSARYHLPVPSKFLELV